MNAADRAKLRAAGAEWAKAHPLTAEQNRRLRALADPRRKAA